MLLTIIVPVSKMAGRLENMKSWVYGEESENLNIVIVHDSKDEETESELRAIINDLGTRNISLVSGKYGGPGAARNAGIELVTTPWFAFWDSDDRPIPNRFLDMVSEAERINADIAVGEFQIRNSSTNRIERYSSTEKNNLKIEIALNPGIWRMAFRTSKYAVSRFPNFLMGEDQCWLSTINFSESNTFVMNKIVYEYIKGEANQLTSMNNSYRDLNSTSEYLIRSLEGASENSKDFLSCLLVKQQISILKRGNLKYKWAALKRIFHVFNSSPKSKLLYFLLEGLKTRKYMKKPMQVIVNGGIGNQLFQLSAGVYFGGNFPLEVLYTKQDRKLGSQIDPSHMLLHRNFNFFVSYVKIPFLLQKILNMGLRLSSQVNNSFLPINLLRRCLLRIIEFIWLLMHPSTHLKIARGLGFFPDFEKISSNRTLLGYFQSATFASRLICPSELLEMSEEFNRSILVPAKEKATKFNPLVVQIRLGDYSENPHFGKLSKEYFEKAIEDALRDSSCDALWLFSNDMLQARDLIPSRLPVPVIEQALDGATPAEVLQVMSLGKVFVISNSTFGWWAAYLAGSENNDVRIYYPEPWFKDIPSPVGLFPSTWCSKPALFD